MKFQVITLFPELIQSVTQSGVLGQGVKAGFLSVDTIQPREFAAGVHRAVDDRPFGGGDGMLMIPEIAEAAIDRARAAGPTRVIYLSPQGARLTDARVRQLAAEPSLTLLCGRYGGVDQRALNALVDEEISIGDYVLAGGELPALVLIEAVARMIPGVLGHEDSSNRDSFAGGLLEEPGFTRPREWRGVAVPEALLSGNHAKIAEWKLRLSQLVSLRKRPDLWAALPAADRAAARRYWEALSEADRAACGLANLRESFEKE